MPVHKAPFSAHGIPADRTTRTRPPSGKSATAPSGGNAAPGAPRSPVRGASAAPPASMPVWRPPDQTRRGTKPVQALSAILRRYFGARGPHLAAMLAYYALVSLVPFVFLAAVARERDRAARGELRAAARSQPRPAGHERARSRAPGQAPRGERRRDRPDRRRRAAVVVARVPVRARIGPQRALRAAQPRIPAPEAHRPRPARHGAHRPPARPHARGHEPDGALEHRAGPLAPGRLADRRRARDQLGDDVPVPRCSCTARCPTRSSAHARCCPAR